MQMLVVSIHDVSPRTQGIVDEMLQSLAQCGVNRCSLLVIPNHHYVGELSKFPFFVSWLKEKQRQGHEIVLHGCYHLRPQKKVDGLFARGITQCYTAGEGEFFDLSYEEAVQKLRAGRAQLEAVGFSKQEVVGFIAPAWLLSAAAEKALQDEGFLYTTRLGGVLDVTAESSDFFQNSNDAATGGVASGLASSNTLSTLLRSAPSILGTSSVSASSKKNLYEPSQSMVYSVRAAWRRAMSLVWNELLFCWATQRKWTLLRIGLHPCDWEHEKIKSHVLSSIKRALTTRLAMTYREWVERKRKQ